MDKVEKMHISEILDMTNLFITSDTLLEIWKDSTQGSNTLEGESVLDIFEQNPDLITELLNNDLEMYTFLVEHDAEESLGFVLIAGKETLLFVNDCKYFKTDVFSIPFDVIMIECNYSAKVVHTLHGQAKKDGDKAMLKRYERLLNSHMSDRNCLKILKKMNLSKCKGIFLMHLSDGHSNEHEFKIEFQKELGVPVYVCKKQGGIL